MYIGPNVCMFDNNIEKVKDDLQKTITSGSKVAVAAACFSMYAYAELKEQLEDIDEFRFIFTSPTFTTDKTKKESKEFFIPRLTRESSLYGTEFEVRLKNELTQKAIAKECADWIKKKAVFKSYVAGTTMGLGYLSVSNRNNTYSYNPIEGFTTVDLGCEAGDRFNKMVTRLEADGAFQFLNSFDSIWKDKNKLEDVTNAVVDSISEAYNENSPEFIYFLTLYHVFSEFLDDISEDVLPNEATGYKDSVIWNMLYDFQQDAALGIINKLEKYNGCILADSVGLGKTFTALAVIKYYENKNNNVLVLCPKKLVENWNTYRENYVNNPILADRLNYKVLCHTDLSRNEGSSNGTDLSRINWGNYDLVVIDESHNFRNGGALYGDEQRENRYLRLMNQVVRAGVKTKVLMLSATPVNNRFSDLRNQLALAYEGDSRALDKELNTTKPLDEVFRQAQMQFNYWSKLPAEERTTDNLLNKLDFDFFEVLDSVTIARSRKHIEKYYQTEIIGSFPKRLPPISKTPDLTDLPNPISFNEIFSTLESLNLEIYVPSAYILPNNIWKYEELGKGSGNNLTQAGREEGIRRLMRVNLLKRLESSVHSFRLTLERILGFINETIQSIDDFEISGTSRLNLKDITNENDFDLEDRNQDLFTVGKKIKIDLADMDYRSWRDKLKEDRDTLLQLISAISTITPEHDSKLSELLSLLSEKVENPINGNNKKVLVFSAFSDTAEYLYEHISKYMKDVYGLNTAIITGTNEGKTTIKGFKNAFGNILLSFSPISKEKATLLPNDKNSIDVLVATDCISEGQNLQDCDYLVNYDIHWNPVRIIQRFGRIDRIGSKNETIQLVNFWPNMTLDEYINLKAKVEAKMKISVMTSTGDDDLLDPEEKGELEYRKEQLEKLQSEVIDLEDISGGISILDLGLNEFRLDLLDYVKNHKDLGRKPFGMHAVAEANDRLPAGVIFVLKNRNDGINIDNLNRVHPFYMVYVAESGEVICDYLNPKRLLDDMRFLCKEQSQPLKDKCDLFNKETDDGKNMIEVSRLLSKAINSIIATKEKGDIDSLFKAGGTSLLSDNFSGLDDFELVSFLVIR